jgi:hypothetical protein
MRRRVLAGLVLAATCAQLAACTVAAPGPVDDAPWKGSGDVEVITAAPDAGGVLSFRNCPTLAEARGAMPAITAGPEANAVPFKTMVLQCSYTLPGRDVQGSASGISILVFDAEADGRTAWVWDPDADAGSRTAIPDLGDRAFATAGRGRLELWVDAGRFGLHLLHTSQDELPLEEMNALARAALTGSERPAR